MYRISIGLLIAGVIAFAPALVRAGELVAVADAVTDGAAPISNYGSGATLRIRRSGDRMVLIKFDQDQLPVNFQPPALLKLHVDTVNVQGRIEVRRVLSDWREGSVTSDTRPLLSTKVVSTHDITREDAGRTITLDVTSLVSEWAAQPDKNFGLAVTTGTRSAQVYFTSRERQPGPTLSTVDLPAATEPTVVAQSGAPAPSSADYEN